MIAVSFMTILILLDLPSPRRSCTTNHAHLELYSSSSANVTLAAHTEEYHGVPISKALVSTVQSHNELEIADF